MGDVSPIRQIARNLKKRVRPVGGSMTYFDHRQLARVPRSRIGVTRVSGKPFWYSDSGGMRHSLHEIFEDQVYKFVAKTDSPRIVDAGANIGLSVLYFKRLYPNSSIVAYEPDGDIFGLLTKNVGCIPGVTLRQAAAWTENTSLTFYQEKSLAGSVSTDFMSLGDKVIVPALRLKDELQKGFVDFLQIDIEGAENQVMFDIADELENVDHLFFEYHSVVGDNQRLGAMLDLVTQKGFRYAINGTHGPRLPFVDSATLGFDLQCNVFCFRPRASV